MATAGSYRDAAGVAGWAFAPDVLAFLGRVLLTTWLYGGAIDNVAPPDGFASTAGFGFTLVAVGWSVYILAQGLGGTHDVSGKAALVPAHLIGGTTLLLSSIVELQPGESGSGCCVAGIRRWVQIGRSIESKP